jgi:hypothetical protein
VRRVNGCHFGLQGKGQTCSTGVFLQRRAGLPASFSRAKISQAARRPDPGTRFAWWASIFVFKDCCRSSTTSYRAATAAILPNYKHMAPPFDSQDLISYKPFIVIGLANGLGSSQSLSATLGEPVNFNQPYSAGDESQPARRPSSVTPGQILYALKPPALVRAARIQTS